MTNTICPKCGSSDVVWDNDERIYGYARYWVSVRRHSCGYALATGGVMRIH